MGIERRMHSRDRERRRDHGWPHDIVLPPRTSNRIYFLARVTEAAGSYTLLQPPILIIRGRTLPAIYNNMMTGRFNIGTARLRISSVLDSYHMPLQRVISTFYWLW